MSGNHIYFCIFKVNQSGTIAGSIRDRMEAPVSVPQTATCMCVTVLYSIQGETVRQI